MTPPTGLISAPPRRIPRWAGWAIAVLVFVAMAPTLGWLELANGIETLHAATVLEMRRDGGSWIMPTLNGTLRIKKPPLPAWIGALAVTDATVAGASSTDPVIRDRAFSRLAWEIRWPALLAGCLMLVATFDLAKTLAGRRAALAATVLTGTSLLFLRYMRLASTDVHLALWVTVGNALLARAILLRQRGCIAAFGLALGLAFMCKGPVAILQTIAPVALLPLLHRRRTATGSGLSQPMAPEPVPARRAIPWRQVFVAVVAFLAVALPWPIMVATSNEGTLAIWWSEITRKDATTLAPDPVYAYLTLLPHLIPWLPAFLLGMLLTLRFRSSRSVRFIHRTKVQRHRGYLLAMLWLAVPILVMSLFKDKNERYLLPLLPPAAILAARGLLAMIAGMRRGRRDAGAWLASHFVLVGGIAIVLPLVGVISPQALPASLTSAWPVSASGGAWYEPRLGLPCLALAIAATVTMFRPPRRSVIAGVGIAAVLMLAANALLLWGYKDTPAGRSEMRPIAERIIAQSAGTRVAYHDPGGKPMPPDLAIYLNRVVRPLEAVRRRGDDEPDIIVMLQRENQRPPSLPGWHSFASEPYGKRYWHALKKDQP
ncbi:ArnT family glycosyltransferase [Humisphaera borealis]|uniref:Glycosyltransferase family 39 protein n=1 Tax=Humisphaera borealis TaxID=2807512 RepID=A0A7M2X428_9BACT|nr:glycosyltransferase family 39 protein [Humisphaera borealis]QOV92202.1 glycosyltransferase family 39 protein [Humisphaera borealis]